MSLRLQTNRVIEYLKEQGLQVGDSTTPNGVGWQGQPGQSDFIPYVIVYPTSGGNLHGTIGAPRSDFSIIYQMTCVGATREQCDWMRDTVRDVIFDRNSLAIDGYRVLDIVLEVPIATTRDDDVQPPVYFSADRFRLVSVPRTIQN